MMGVSQLLRCKSKEKAPWRASRCSSQGCRQSGRLKIDNEGCYEPKLIDLQRDGAKCSDGTNYSEVKIDNEKIPESMDLLLQEERGVFA
jgi:hypothetical protein